VEELNGEETRGGHVSASEDHALAPRGLTEAMEAV
jgi:hypothetical protein